MGGRGGAGGWKGGKISSVSKRASKSYTNMKTQLFAVYDSAKSGFNTTAKQLYVEDAQKFAGTLNIDFSSMFNSKRDVTYFTRLLNKEIKGFKSKIGATRQSELNLRGKEAMMKEIRKSFNKYKKAQTNKEARKKQSYTK